MFEYIKTLLARKDNIPWRHKTMSDVEKANFLARVDEVENNHPCFKWMKQTRPRMMLWVTIVILFGIRAIDHATQDNYELRDWVTIREFMEWYPLQMICPYLLVITQYVLMFGCFILGLLNLQIGFVGTHWRAHAEFLNYEKHVPQNITKPTDKLSWVIWFLTPTWGFDLPVYNYAFVHHHHQEPDNPTNWAPALSYYEPEGDRPGSRNIAVAHWHGYTMIGSTQLVYVLFWMWLCPMTGLFFFGHEVATLLLPASHGWQHTHNNKMGPILNPVFRCLEWLGVIANSEDHEKHHVHDGPTVYQDFSSSGLYMKSVDKILNKIWDCCCYYAMDTGRKPVDILNVPINILVIGMKIGFPVLIYWTESYRM